MSPCILSVLLSDVSRNLSVLLGAALCRSLLFHAAVFLLQLSELVSTEGYSEWVQLVADFTIKSLQSWQVSSWVYHSESTAAGTALFVCCCWRHR